MPRNSSGDYSLPSGTLVSTGDTLLVSQHNPPMQDLEQALSSSLDRDGRGGMRSDLSMNSNRITDLEDGVNPSDAATVGQITDVGGGVPIGAVIDYWGTAPPSGWFFAAGQAISRATYAELFTAIGTNAGAGDGSTTFNLPDYRGRVPAGRENMVSPATTRLNTMSSSTLGASGGAQTHTLTEAQLAAHDHPVTDPGHTHSESKAQLTATASSGFTVDLTRPVSGTTGSATTGVTVGNAGGGEAHNNIQPTLICNKIIRVS